MKAAAEGLSCDAPLCYLEMLVLPRQGIPYKPIAKLGGYEHWLMFEMLSMEAKHAVAPRHR